MSQNGDPPEVRIFCIDLTHYNKTTKFLICCSGIFGFYLVYGYLQELIFTLDGFKPFGWFLTLIQFFYYVVFAVCERKFENPSADILSRKIPLKVYALLSLLTLGTMGLSNSSLGYLNYPTQVIFKCCKLIPVLIGSIVIQGKKHGPLDFMAALCMCVGLTLFTLADSQVSPNFNTFGVFMICMALLCDAAIGNVQEKAMREYSAPSNEIVFWSYGIGFLYLFVIMLLSGSLYQGVVFCSQVCRFSNVFVLWLMRLILVPRWNLRICIPLQHYWILGNTVCSNLGEDLWSPDSCDCDHSQKGCNNSFIIRFLQQTVHDSVCLVWTHRGPWNLFECLQ